MLAVAAQAIEIEAVRLYAKARLRSCPVVELGKTAYINILNTSAAGAHGVWVFIRPPRIVPVGAVAKLEFDDFSKLLERL